MESYASIPRGGEFVVEGGHPISGTIVPSGNKNEALPVLAASLLCRGPFFVENVPKIRDVATLLEVLKHLDVAVETTGDHELMLDSRGAHGEPDPQLAQQIRGSFLLAPGLLHRQGRAVLPRPGGDKIGRRRLDTHLLALRQLGADVEGERLLRAHAQRRVQGGRHLPRRSQRDGDGERGHGRRGRQGDVVDPQRRIRAPRPGSLPRPECDGREDLRNRDEPAHRRGSRRSAPARAIASARTTSRSARSSRSRR